MKDTIKLKDKKGVLMIAHRGVSGLEAENTAAAFVAAGNRTYYGVETDVHRTADGKFVCLHDEDIFRVSGVHCNVGEVDYEKVASIRQHKTESDFGPRADYVAPQLEDYVSICHAYGKHCILELKDEFTVEELKQIISILQSIGHLQDTTFISFLPQNLIRMRELLPEQSIQLLTEKITDEIIEGAIKYKIDLDVVFFVLDEEIVKKIKSHGIKLNTFTINDPEIAQKLIDMGVDFITTNILE